PPFEQILQVTPYRQHFREPTQPCVGRRECQVIPHDGLLAFHVKEVVMAEAVKGSAHHGVLEVMWELESRNPAGMGNGNPEKAGTPGNFFAQSDKPCGDPSNRPFLCLASRD